MCVYKYSQTSRKLIFPRRPFGNRLNIYRYFAYKRVGILGIDGERLYDGGSSRSGCVRVRSPAETSARLPYVSDDTIIMYHTRYSYPLNYIYYTYFICLASELQ